MRGILVLLTVYIALAGQVCAAGPVCKPGKFPDPFTGDDYIACPVNLTACAKENIYARQYCYLCCGSSTATPTEITTERVVIGGLRKDRFLVVVGVAVVGGVVILVIVVSFVRRHRMTWNTPACGVYYLGIPESPPVVRRQPRPTVV